MTIEFNSVYKHNTYSWSSILNATMMTLRRALYNILSRRTKITNDVENLQTPIRII